MNLKLPDPKILRNPKYLILIVLVIIGFVGTAYFYNSYRVSQAEVDRLANNPKEAQKEEVRRMVEAVGKLVQLPANETPTVATVSDKDKLKGQTFFSQAENGDKVLIFNQAGKAILYRPSTNKVIEIAPVNIGQNQTKTTTPTTTTPTK